MIAREDMLWTPDNELRIPEDYEINPQLLRETFARFVAHENAEVVSLHEASLSAVTIPEITPAGFLFIDIDDFVGDLSGSLQALQYAEPIPTQERINNHDYGEGLFFSDEETLTKQALIALLKNSEIGMRPAADIDTIRDYIIGLQAAGIYVTFLTAATPASELATVDHFLGKHFRNACDALVITSGDYQVADKGTAAVDIIDFIDKHTKDSFQQGAPVVAIDDWPRHTAKIRNALAKLPHDFNVTTIQYVFPSSQDPDIGSLHVNTTLGCFEVAFEIFRRTLTKTRAETRAN